MTSTNSNTQKHRIDPENALDFVLAGHALFTVRNTETGGRFTFKVCQGEERNGRPAPHFVKVRANDKDDGNYTYVGAIFDRQTFRLTRASRVTAESLAFRAFKWVFNRLLTGTLPETIEIWHEGRCGRCGLVLTVPESIATGLGPVCAGNVAQAKAPDRYDLKETGAGLLVIEFYRLDGRDVPNGPAKVVEGAGALAEWIAYLEANEYTVRRWPGGARAFKGEPWAIRTMGQIRRRRDDVNKMIDAGQLPAVGFYWLGLDFAFDF